MVGVQAEGAMPVVRAFLEGRKDAEVEKEPETIATAIRIGNPVNARKALRAIRESKGSAMAVSDAEITEAQRELAVREGIGVEPASAAGLAGLRRMISEGRVERGERIVCVTTGHVLKDPESAMRASSPPRKIKRYEDLFS
jgi:threonine synthase